VNWRHKYLEFSAWKLDFGAGIKRVGHGGPWGTVPELLFEKKQLITALQQLLLNP
jgi:hypothetical protein